MFVKSKGHMLACPVLNHSKTLIHDNLHFHRQLKVIAVVIFPSLKKKKWFLLVLPHGNRIKRFNRGIARYGPIE
jgi:hypothetical protein